MRTATEGPQSVEMNNSCSHDLADQDRQSGHGSAIPWPREYTPGYLENGSKPTLFVRPNIDFAGTRRTHQLPLLYPRGTPPPKSSGSFLHTGHTLFSNWTEQSFLAEMTEESRHRHTVFTCFVKLQHSGDSVSGKLDTQFFRLDRTVISW